MIGRKWGKIYYLFFADGAGAIRFCWVAIISKVVMDDGMNPYVHLSYRQIFATISIAPFAYFIERVTGMQMTYLIGLKNSTATITTALANLVPAITFLLAVLSGLEKVGLRSKAGQGKVIGTILCICGAMLLSLYHGKVLIGQLGFHWKYSQHDTSKNIIDPNYNSHRNFFLGPFLVIMSTILYSLWLIIQPQVNKRIVGSILTVIGLYGFLWGKKKEMERIKEEKVFNKKNQLTNKIDLEELQFSENSNHKFTVNPQSKI
ncbi:hypothetical protein HAX54_044852 [Datura stramonium]|uniref:WAT1-related protein n=1 Tax=Datura stramonium TaxID=4076 RepID=A0ABS8RSL1_DATST|nr:hypothetical protein [Datura stramonium]